MRTQSKNPIVIYLSRRAWEWVSADDIIKAVGCTRTDIEETASKSGGWSMYQCSVENKGDMFRYIGNCRSTARQIVMHLKDVYPLEVFATDIAKEVNVTSYRVGQIIKSFQPYMPIATHRSSLPYAGGCYIKYQYIPNDVQSLVEAE